MNVLEFWREMDVFLRKMEQEKKCKILFYEPPKTNKAESYVRRGSKQIIVVQDEKIAREINKSLVGITKEKKNLVTEYKDEKEIKKPYVLNIKTYQAYGNITLKIIPIPRTFTAQKKEIKDTFYDYYFKQPMKNYILCMYPTLKEQEEHREAIAETEKEYMAEYEKYWKQADKILSDSEEYKVTYYHDLQQKKNLRATFYNPESQKKIQTTIGDVLILVGDSIGDIIEAAPQKTRADKISKIAQKVDCWYFRTMVTK